MELFRDPTEGRAPEAMRKRRGDVYQHLMRPNGVIFGAIHTGVVLEKWIESWRGSKKYDVQLPYEKDPSNPAEKNYNRNNIAYRGYCFLTQDFRGEPGCDPTKEITHIFIDETTSPKDVARHLRTVFGGRSGIAGIELEPEEEFPEILAKAA